MSLSEEEFKQHQKMKRLEAEAKEEVRKHTLKLYMNSMNECLGQTNIECPERGQDEGHERCPAPEAQGDHRDCWRWQAGQDPAWR